MKKLTAVLLMIIFSFCLPLIWLAPKYIYIAEENNFANYQKIAYNNLYSWSSNLNYGNPSGPADHSVLFNGIFYYLLEKIGLSNYIIQLLYLFLIIFGILISIYFFLRLFIKSDLIVIIGTAAYLLNFLTQSSIFYSAKMFQLIFIPAVFVFLFKYFESKNFKYLIYNFILFFLLQGVFTNLPQAFATFLVYPIFFLFLVFNHSKNEKAYREKWKHFLLFFVLSVPVVLYQGLVYWFSDFQNFKALKAIQTFKALHSPISLVLQLRGSWWESQKYASIAYNHWLSFYNNPIIIIISFFVVLISLLPFIFRKRLNHVLWNIYLFFSVLFISSVFFASGTNFCPFLYEWLFKNIPMFYIFREPWVKFMPFVLLSLVAMFSIALTVIRNKILLYSTLILILIRGLPFFSLDFFDKSNLGWKKLFISPPSYWYEYKNWTTDNKNKYVLADFLSDSWVNYKWYNKNFGNSNFPMYYLLGRNNNIFFTKFGLGNSCNSLIGLFYKENSLDFVRLCPIDFLLKQNDVILNDYVNNSSRQNIVYNYFNEDGRINFSNKLFLYPIKEEYRVPHIYSCPEVTVISAANDNIDIFIPLSYTKYMESKPGIIFMNKNSFIREIFSKNSYNFVLENNFWQNLPIELAKGGKEIVAKNSGIYEIYIVNMEEKIPEFDISVDGINWGVCDGAQIKYVGVRYIKLGEVELGSGRHVVSGVYYTEIGEMNPELILVNKTVREDFEKVVQKNTNQSLEICYILEQKKGGFYVP